MPKEQKFLRHRRKLLPICSSRRGVDAGQIALSMFLTVRASLKPFWIISAEQGVGFQLVGRVGGGVCVCGGGVKSVFLQIIIFLFAFWDLPSCDPESKTTSGAGVKRSSGPFLEPFQADPEFQVRWGGDGERGGLVKWWLVKGISETLLSRSVFLWGGITWRALGPPPLSKQSSFSLDIRTQRTAVKTPIGTMR